MHLGTYIDQGHEGLCRVCGTPTTYTDLVYNTWICSAECYAEMDARAVLAQRAEEVYARY